MADDDDLELSELDNDDIELEGEGTELLAAAEIGSDAMKTSKDLEAV